MRKLLSFIPILILANAVCYGQSTYQSNYQSNHQSNVIINNQPVIEKKEYIIKYRPVYIEKPQPKRYARRLSAPICLLNYLWVYPEDLGTYTNGPEEIIRQINKQCLHGRNDWRVPTSDELCLMENYANECGLGDGIYLSTSHRNGILRLVSSGKSIQEQNYQAYSEQLQRANELAYGEAQREAQKVAEQRAVINKQKHLILTEEARHIDNLLWASRNVGARDIFDKGVAYSKQPDKAGWRLPTANEFLKLVKQSTKYSNYFEHPSGLIIPNGVYTVKLSNGNEGTIMLPSMMVSGSKNMPTLFRLVQDKVY